MRPESGTERSGRSPASSPVAEYVCCGALVDGECLFETAAMCYHRRAADHQAQLNLLLGGFGGQAKVSLKGKVVIVTGAGRGIGRAVALRFAAEGAKLVVVARTAKQIDRVAADVRAQGGTGIAIPADIACESDVEAMIARTDAELGPVDVLINNAGVMILRPVAQTSLEEWQEVIGTNLTGVFLCSRAVLPLMMRRRTGRIINIGSLAGRRGYPDQGVYCASKHGLYGLSKVLAIEGQPYGIRVNVVSPGGALTELSKELLATRKPSEAKEWMTPEEVAEGVYYIATQEGPATTDELVLRRFASEPWR